MARAGVGVARGMVARGVDGDPLAPLAQAIETLAELRGLAAKVGQMGGIASAMLPPAERERAERLLARLRAHAATSSAPEVRRVIEAELGAPLAALFLTFDPEPFASASIGQVHRATLLDGTTEVAVKVQHPGIASALRADLANVQGVGGLGAVLALTDARAVLDEVRSRFEAELDYLAEARSLSRFAQIFAGDPEIAIPVLVPERSSATVLTTHLVRGADVDAAAGWPCARSLGLAVRRFLRTSWLDHGLLFADPHAGNWIFHPEGRVTVIDFGCVIPFEVRERSVVSSVLEAISRGDDANAGRELAPLIGAPAGPAGELLVESLRLALAPLTSERPARAADLEEVMRVSADAKKRLIGRRMPMPPWLPLVLRALLGTAALLVALEREVAPSAS